MNITQWIMEHKWAITSSALETIIEIASKDHDLSTETIAKMMHGSAWERYVDKSGSVIDYQSIAASDYPVLDGTRRVSMAGRVAIIPVIGPIFPRANLMTMSGGTSLQSLAYDFNIALNSSEVDAIIMNIDSPGGVVTGVVDYSEMVYKANSAKTIISYVYGFGASAAYWMGSSASEIVLSPTAEVGSIGVVAGYTDSSKAKEKRGVTDIEIVSSQSPNKRLDPATTSGRNQIQAIVDQLADVFINAVARNRGVSYEDVLTNFGQGKMFVGEDAVTNGLADRIGSLEMLIEEQRAQSAENTNNFFLGGIMDIKTLMAEHPAVYAEVIAIGKQEADAGITAKVEEARKAGADAENARIKAIEEIAVPGSSKVIAEHKFDSSKTADEISTLILKSQQEQMASMQGNLDRDGEDLANLASGVGTGEIPQAGEAEEKSAIDAMVSGMNGYQK